MPLKIIKNDITKIKADALVNAANRQLICGGGVCGAIFKAAGKEKLQKECNRIGCCEVGKAVITSAYNLKAKYIIHAVGPIWHGGNANEAELLHNCYISSLELAEKYQCTSVAFPLISSGIYGYPKDEAYNIAVNSINQYLKNHKIDVYLVIFS